MSRRCSRFMVLPVCLAVLGTPSVALPALAGTVVQITDDRTSVAGPGALDDAGTALFTGTSADVAGVNPDHTFQVVRFDPLTGAASQVTGARKGTAALVSVSDDGQWLAFTSPANLTGQNPDESLELFVISADGSVVTQLTDDPAPNAGSVGTVAISGDGSRVAFVANTDPLTGNPDHLDQLFVVQRDGAGLAQLTQITPAAGGSFGAISVSDDGTRIAFGHSGDVTGQNADLGGEVFAIGGDGSNLRQLTLTPLGFDSGAPTLSGNGQSVALQSDADFGANPNNQTEIHIIDWASTDPSDIRKLTSTGLVLGIAGDPTAQSPSITDDGGTIVFHSNNSRLFPPLNIDGNFEIFRIQSDGTGLTALTSTLLQAGSFLPVVSGNGGRVAYYGIDTDADLRVMDGSGGSQRDLLTFELVLTGDPDVSPDGGRAVFVRSTGLFGGGQLWRVGTDGSGLAQVTTLASGSPAGPSIAGDGTTIVFSADSNPDGVSNNDGSEEIFRVQTDGSGLAQVTSGPADTASRNPVVSADGSLVVFDSDADLTGDNPDLSREIFRVALDGSGLQQLTDGAVGTTSRLPRPDATGGWVVFESNADLTGGNADGSYEIFRISAGGGTPWQITADPALDSRSPDVSGDGDLVTFSSSSDPLGTNPDGNSEVFVFDAVASTTRQLTSFTEGNSGSARISGDGTWVYLSSSAPVFEWDPDTPTDLYRVPAAGGTIERVGALRTAGAGAGGVPVPLGTGSALAVGDSGEVAVFSALGDSTGDNPDALPELWAIDRAAAGRLDVGRPSPTELRWTPESGPVRYDVIRGDLAQLTPAGATIDLGPVACLEEDSPDADTVGFGDAVEPGPGQVLFFLHRGSQGLLDGPGTYGTATDGRERLAGSGDCIAN